MISASRATGSQSTAAREDVLRSDGQFGNEGLRQLNAPRERDLCWKHYCSYRYINEESRPEDAARKEDGVSTTGFCSGMYALVVRSPLLSYAVFSLVYVALELFQSQIWLCTLILLHTYELVILSTCCTSIYFFAVTILITLKNSVHTNGPSWTILPIWFLVVALEWKTIER